MAKNVKVIDTDNEVHTDVLAKAILELQASAKRLLASGLTRDALALLVSHNMAIKDRLPPRRVLDVLDAAAGLGRFVKGGR